MDINKNGIYAKIKLKLTFKCDKKHVDIFVLYSVQLRLRMMLEPMFSIIEQ